MFGGLDFNLVDCVLQIWSQVEQELLQLLSIGFQILYQLLLVFNIMEQKANRGLGNGEMVQRGEIGVVLIGDHGAETGFDVVFVEVLRPEGDSEGNVCLVHVDDQFLLVLDDDEQGSELGEELAGLLSAEGGEERELLEGDLAVFVGVNLIKHLIKVGLGN